MNAEVKKAWVAALRSGEYKQGYEKLTDEVNGVRSHCCLGVLCDVARKAEIVEMEMYEALTYLPYKVTIWAELERDNPLIPDHDFLAILNDGVCGSERHSFTEIADLIEKYL